MNEVSDDDRVHIEHVLDALHAARVAGDLARLTELFADGAQFRISGSSDGKPISISAHSGGEIRGWLAVLLKSFSVSGYKMISRVIDGHRAAVHWRAVIHSRITGARVATELVDLVEVRSGKIASYVEFFAPV